jgi:hypothetical protein
MSGPRNGAESATAFKGSDPAGRRRILLALAGLSLAAFGPLLAAIPSVVEWHRVSVYPRQAAILQSISGVTSWPIGEPAIVCAALLAPFFILRKRRDALVGAAWTAGVLAFFFYSLWGLSYRYGPLGSRLAALPERPKAAEKAWLLDLAGRATALVAEASNRSPPDATGAKDFLRRLNAGLDEGFAKLPSNIDVVAVRGIAFGPVKPSRVSFAMSRLQVSGYYLPWFGEAHINAQMPRSLWARVASHEKAHQQGFARENEATVIGLLACLSSSDPLVFYGGALGLFAALDRPVARLDPDLRRALWKRLPARAVTDFDTETAFWKANEGPADVVGEKVYDTYLKAQGVQSGVASYGETTRLLLQAIETKTLKLHTILTSRPSVTDAK